MATSQEMRKPYEGGLVNVITDKIASFMSAGDLIACLTFNSPQHNNSSFVRPENDVVCHRKQRAPERAGEEDDEHSVLVTVIKRTAPSPIPEEHGLEDCESGLPKKQKSCSKNSNCIVKSIVILSLKPSFVAFDFLKGAVTTMLDRLPLLTLLQWSSCHISLGWHLAENIGRYPIVLGRHLINSVLQGIDTMFLVVSEIWFELRQMGIHELISLVSSLLRRDHGAPSCCNSSENRAGSTMNSINGGHVSISMSSGGSKNNSNRKNYSFSWDPFGHNSGTSGTDSVLGFGFPVDEIEKVDPVVLQRQAELRNKLDFVNRTARLVSYHEKANRSGSNIGNLSKTRAERVRRMMHYDVPLQPFHATVAIDPHSISPLPVSSSGNISTLIYGGKKVYMCTPQSFPPTPISRACVMSRTTQFSDDVLFLARDHLRLDEQCHSGASDETTRLTAEFLKSQARLAVLNGHAAAEGILLTCGHHCAVKTGMAQLYSSVRAMVPVLRNRFVFCQFSVTAQESVVPSLSVGLSTPDMPLNTLVGTWAHSIGLSSSGQMLLSSRWYSCLPGHGAYEVGSTIGVLVYLDGAASFTTWDGEMVTAYVTYSVDGQPIRTALRPPADSDSTVVMQGVVRGCSGADTGIYPPCTMALPLPRDRDLFPTLTLHSPNIQVFCRFCAADMVHATRLQIGAPPDVPVYALDGSVVLHRDCNSNSSL